MGLLGLFVLDKGKPVVRPGRKAKGRDGCTSVWQPGCRRNVAASSSKTRHRIQLTGFHRGTAGHRRLAKAGAARDESRPTLSYRCVAGRKLLLADAAFWRIS